jgi:hypothetical protein
MKTLAVAILLLGLIAHSAFSSDDYHVVEVVGSIPTSATKS